MNGWWDRRSACSTAGTCSGLPLPRSCFSFSSTWEAIRYTLYTGEPIVTGFMRVRPGPRFLGSRDPLLCVVQLGLPAVAAGSAATVFATFAAGCQAQTTPASWPGRRMRLLFWLLSCYCSARQSERTLERVSWIMVAFIFGFLALVNVFFVPARDWMSTLTGFFSVGSLPDGTTWP